MCVKMWVSFNLSTKSIGKVSVHMKFEVTNLCYDLAISANQGRAMPVSSLIVSQKSVVEHPTKI